jgi:hypothetical protein
MHLCPCLFPVHCVHRDMYLHQPQSYTTYDGELFVLLHFEGLDDNLREDSKKEGDNDYRN